MSTPSKPGPKKESGVDHPDHAVANPRLTTQLDMLPSVGSSEHGSAVEPSCIGDAIAKVVDGPQVFENAAVEVPPPPPQPRFCRRAAQGVQRVQRSVLARRTSWTRWGGSTVSPTAVASSQDHDHGR